MTQSEERTAVPAWLAWLTAPAGKPQTSLPEQCSICLKSDFDSFDPLISLCQCEGPSGHVHRLCLARQKGLKNPRDIASYRCDVCHSQYQFSFLTKVCVDIQIVFSERVIPAISTALRRLVTIFIVVCILLCVASTLLLGFIPLVQNGLRLVGADSSWHTPSSWWARLLLHEVNGLLLAGWLVGGHMQLASKCNSPPSNESWWWCCAKVLALGPILFILLLTGLAKSFLSYSRSFIDK